MTRFAAALAVCALGLSACAAPPGTTRLSAGETVDIAAIGAQVSVQRAAQGIVRPLLHSPALQAAAETHARDLAETGRVSHTGSDGSDLSDRVARSGYDACLEAENIAQGQTTARAVLDDWLASEGHRANLLNPQVTQFGVARDRETWVLVLARPC